MKLMKTSVMQAIARANGMELPQVVLDQYGMKYDERTLNEGVKFDA